MRKGLLVTVSRVGSQWGNYNLVNPDKRGGRLTFKVLSSVIHRTSRNVGVVSRGMFCVSSLIYL